MEAIFDLIAQILWQNTKLFPWFENAHRHDVLELLVIKYSDMMIHQVQVELSVKNPKITLYIQYI